MELSGVVKIALKNLLFPKSSYNSYINTNHEPMNMKTISSKEAQNAFGAFLDTAQREPVIITRRKRPVTLTISMDNLPAIMEFANSMREQIKTGVKAGLVDAEAGRGQELTNDYVQNLKQELQKRIDNKQGI